MNFNIFVTILILSYDFICRLLFIYIGGSLRSANARNAAGENRRRATVVLFTVVVVGPSRQCCFEYTHVTTFSTTTVNLSETKLGTLRLLLLGGTIENQNSDFVMQ
jgi:hypothetical protein